jgi:hypothetical protein
MADRQDSDREVLTSLPRSRPVRRSAKRGERVDATKSTASPSRRAAASTPRAARTTAAGAAKATAAKPRRAPTTAAAGAGAKPRASTERPRVAPQRKVPPAGYAAPSSARSDEPPGSGAADLIGTTLQAAAELAQIGLTVGRQTLQSMFDRLPRP